MHRIHNKIAQGQRIDFDEAKKLYLEADFYELGFLAHAVRRRKHPNPVVTYVSDRNINYSNVCTCGCKFCAFYKGPEQSGGYIISPSELAQKIEETLALGGTQILMQGGHHPDMPLSWYETMLRSIKEKYPVHIHAFSPPEIIYFSELNHISVAEVIQRLHAAGLDSIPGGGAEILVDSVRKEIAPRKCSSQQWLGVMEEAHRQGLKTTVTMMFGHVESPEQRLEHLFAVRASQDKTGGYTAFIPWTFQPDHTALSHCRKLSSVEYLRTLAISRIVLDNIENIQVSWVTMGPGIAQMGLHFGGNDFGSTMIEENVVKATGVAFRLSKEEIDRLISDAGFTPAQRTMDYTLLEDSL